MCNNWITCTRDDNGEYGYGGQPINPRTVRFEKDSIEGVLQRHENGELGTMFKGYDLEHFKKTGEFRYARR